MPAKKTYYPPKTFDDDLTALANLFKSKGWSFSNIDSKQLAADAITQRSERTDHDATESTWLNVHEKFGLAQEERYRLFSSALNAARGAFRNDKAVMKELNKFNRSMRGPKKKTA